MKRKPEPLLPSSSSSQDLANKFALFFHNKTENIRVGILEDKSTNYSPPSNTIKHTETFHTFLTVTVEENAKLIKQCPTKSYTQDPLPTWLLKEELDVFVPIITDIVNQSLSSGIFPMFFKTADITPLLKKAHWIMKFLKITGWFQIHHFCQRSWNVLSQNKFKNI